MGRFQYGVCEWSLKARGKELCRIASKQGLDCLQLGVGEEALEGKGLGCRAVIEEYMQASADYGMEICSLSPQFVDQYSFTMPQGAQEEQIAAELVDRTIKLCTVFGCKSFLLPVLGRNGICDGPSFHRAAAYIKRFSEKAADLGIETHLEINRSVKQVYNLLDAVDNPKVKLFFDSQNLYVYDGTSMARYFTELSGLIGGVHLKDGVGPMLSGSLLGEGTSGFFKTARAILDSDYTGPLIIESVYDKASVCGRGSQEELLARDTAMLRRTFG
ncbi:sugar phosphate isomerase/epimerase family protein [Anaerotruncus colihominis]|nr:TIM barrel protein [Anaerotruncus colihominis]